MALLQALRQSTGSMPVALRSAGVASRTFATVPDDTEITVEVNPVQCHRIDGPDNKVTTTRGQLLAWYKQMYGMRRMEIAADMLYKSKLIRGFCHLYDGQEAVICGLEDALEHSDSIITSYRDHATHIGRGGSYFEVFAELFGRVGGAAKGLGGSMHMYRKEANFYGGCGIVGAQIPLGAGLGFAHKYRKDNGVAVTMYGDGAANQGQKYEALNLAAIWDLPVIFVCENNHYGMGTAEWRSAKSSEYYTRGDYVPGIKCDGMDILATANVAAFAKKHAQEKGPIVLEFDTYRYHGHSMSDPGSTYRTRDEINTWRQSRDPVERVKKLLLEHELADASEIKKIDKAIKKEIDEAVEQAKASPQPPPELLWTNLYSNVENVEMRGMTNGTKYQCLSTPYDQIGK